MAKATKKNKDKKSRDSARAEHAANRRFKQKYGVKRSKAESIDLALTQALAAKEATDE